MKATVKVHRFWQDGNQTSGTCVVLDDKGFPTFAGLSLERGWQNNKNMVSCYPKGVYKLKYEYSNRFGKSLWEVKDVPNRSECKFHAANYWFELNGCTALGLRYQNLNKDNYRDVTNSGNTMAAFELALKGCTDVTLIVTAEPGIF